jgi:hypothetical protein
LTVALAGPAEIAEKRFELPIFSFRVRVIMNLFETLESVVLGVREFELMKLVVEAERAIFMDGRRRRGQATIKDFQIGGAGVLGRVCVSRCQAHETTLFSRCRGMPLGGS